MNKIKKYGLQTVMLVALLAGLWSCSSMDEGYQDSIRNGEISYTGKIDSLHIYGGKNRVNVKGLIISDPKVTEVRVFWNSRKDSVVVPITRTSGVDVLDVIINGLDENIYNFEVRTYDKLGNKSIPVFKIGNTYGQRYEATLLADIMNRKISTGISSGGVLNGTLETLNDYTKKSAYSILTYTATNDTQKQLIIPSTQSAFTITDFKSGTDLKYKTAYKPEEGSIDVFFTPEKTFYTQTDVTSTYIVNAGFETNPTGAATDNYIYDVSGWTEYPVSGSFTYKKLGTINYGSNTVPFGIAPLASTNSIGETTLLGIKQHWLPSPSQLYIEQSVTLPVGTYTLTWKSLVGQTVTGASSMMGYEMDGLGIYDGFSSATDTWKNHSLVFVVTTPKTVKFRMGYNKTANVGGGSSPILFVDNLKLLQAKL
ncbi:protein of unknown function [Flavobacterium glycines]|uniref:DUF5013 domain-containing protein n=2 Tax=Flavobacterium glycines TaxID=551990 RepID=A0A511CDL0_9FLAO|nr:DUF4998 domain-containing protein [Flavobacterium glycines]GEL10629.1 hypothetical protein FGL01_13680 [Flavobacterium glycines]SDI60690.1 protein of unknown function [Flavobacterium glycines]